jgi:RimJ/RimL family protein N-acetyltransferase
VDLYTARLRLRRFQSSDLENMIELESNPEIMKFTPARVPFAAEQSAERLKNTVEKNDEREPLGIWAIEELSSRNFVGWIMLMMTRHDQPEVGYMIVQRHWGKGYATEATGRIVDYGLNELGHGGILATIDPDNQLSRRVLQKLGFKYLRTILLPHKLLQQEVPAEILQIIKN